MKKNLFAMFAIAMIMFCFIACDGSTSAEKGNSLPTFSDAEFAQAYTELEIINSAFSIYAEENYEDIDLSTYKNNESLARIINHYLSEVARTIYNIELTEIELSDASGKLSYSEIYNNINQARHVEFTNAHFIFNCGGEEMTFDVNGRHDWEMKANYTNSTATLDVKFTDINIKGKTYPDFDFTAYATQSGIQSFDGSYGNKGFSEAQVKKLINIIGG